METLSLVLALGFLQGTLCENYIITVDPTKNRKPMKHFWKSTGFCIANGRPEYDFSKLDSFIDLLLENGLKPGFELMGSPSGYFTDFEDKKQVIEWRNFIYLTAKRYIEKYGLQNVAEWNFETWNEPDNHDFDNVSLSVKGFQNYYDASSEGLKAASFMLKFGGPGDSCRSPPRSPICWGLLAHCFNGTNYFTQETGVRLDYIALHKKGAGSSFNILKQEIDTVDEIQKRFPKFKSIPIFNDEADPLVGWSTPQPWRGDVTYAAMVVKVIDQHQDFLLWNESNSFNYSLLSNDNAFMNYYPHYFTQRTLTARFQMNNTKPPHVQMVRKPVLTVMGLLALLGEVSISTEVLKQGNKASNDGIIGVMASSHDPEKSKHSDSWQSAVLLYGSDDNRTSPVVHYVTVNLTNYPKSKDLLYVTYYIDNKLTNPYLVWQDGGSPDFPTVELFKQIRNAEDPVVSEPTAFPRDGNMILKLKLPVPSVFFIHICERPQEPPGQVTDLSIVPLTVGQIAVAWSDENVIFRCLKTYEVEFSQDGSIFKRINKKDSIFTLFIYSPENTEVSGSYRVRAVNYWGVPGPYCNLEKYKEDL
uniref:Alpha-L-iduronidase n=1 Tax=Leptobrachium leishanense TaxID=445787 RepID=A0A8C5LV15_9ANUR